MEAVRMGHTETAKVLLTPETNFTLRNTVSTRYFLILTQE